MSICDNCGICACGGCCLAGNGDDDFVLASKEKIIDNLKHNRYLTQRDLMIKTLKEKYSYEWKEIQTMSKDYSNLEGLMGNVKESIKNAYDKGYKQGFKDGIKSEYEHDHAIVKAYNDGQAYILDKIRSDIEKAASRYTISRERGAMGHVEWSDRLIKESEILEIIDIYREVNE